MFRGVYRHVRFVGGGSMKHSIVLLFNGGQVTLKSWRRAMHPKHLHRELATYASELFPSWQWASDGDAGAVINPEDSDCLLMLVDNPRSASVPFL